MEEKSAAINTLGMLALATGNGFKKYFHRSFEWLLKHIEYFHFMIQRNSALAMEKIILACFPHPIPPNYPPPERHRFKTVIGSLMEVCVVRILEEPDKETVARICDLVAELTKAFGWVVIEEKQQQIVECIEDLMNHDTECFVDEQLEFEGMVQGDHERIVFNSTLNLIDQVAKAWGQNFEPIFSKVFERLIFYLKRNNSEDRVAVLGTLAEVTLGIQGKIGKYANEFMPIVLSLMKESKDVAILRNGIFCVGAVTLYAPQVVAPHSQQVLGLIHRVLSQPNNFARVVVDNACGAMGRVCLSVGPKLGPQKMEEMMELIFRNLPLREDFEEYEGVFQCLCTLLQKEHPLAMKHFGRIVKIMDAVQKNNHDQLPNKVRVNLRTMLGFLNKKYPQKMRSVFQM